MLKPAALRRAFRSLIFLFFILCFFVTAHSASAQAVQLVFTTDSQTVLPNMLSSAITVQMQNAESAQELTAETTDLVFTSTSPTGKFESSTGKPVSKTMSKGTANRTFYYIDPTLGTYTLTVTATGRTSKQAFSAIQQIVIGTPPPVVVHVAPITTQPKAAAVPTATKTTKASSKKVSTVSATSSSSVSDSGSSDIQSSTTESAAVIYSAESKTSFFDSILDWPGKFWKWLTGIF